jgi:hypothetical protein
VHFGGLVVESYTIESVVVFLVAQYIYSRTYKGSMIMKLIMKLRRDIPWKERDTDALSWLVNEEPPPLKFGDLFEPHVPVYVSAELVSSYVVFDTVALD